MGSLGESFIIMLDNDEIYIHAGVLKTIGIIQQEQHYQTRNENENIELAVVYLGLPGEFVRSIPIPAEMQPYDMFLFGIVSETGEMVFHNAMNLGNVDRQRIVSLDADGRVAHVRDLPSESPQLADYLLLSGLATITPAGPILVAGILDAASQEMNGQSPGLLGRQILRDPTRSLLVLSIMLASAFWSALAARHSATRRGFTGHRRLVWISIGLAFGPAGWLTLRSLYRRPARVACHRQRVVDREDCEHCGKSFESPEKNGTEILKSISNFALLLLPDECGSTCGSSTPKAYRHACRPAGGVDRCIRCGCGRTRGPVGTIVVNDHSHA